MVAETKAVPYDSHSVKDSPNALSEEARAALREFGEKYWELIDNADLLSPPMKAIAQFVKEEIGGEGKEDA